jgi:hypothetical protein
MQCYDATNPEEHMDREERPEASAGADVAALCRRVEALERQNRRVKRVAGALGIVVSCIAVMGVSRRPRVVEAERFVLKNAAGQTVGELAPDGPGATFKLTSSTSGAVAEVSSDYFNGVTASGVVTVSNGSSSAGLDSGGPGMAPVLSLVDASSEGRVASGGLSFLRTRAGGGQVQMGGSQIGLYPQIALRLSDDGHPSLVLEDASRWASVLGSAALTVGGTQAGQGPAAALTLFAPDGRVIGQLP